MSTYSHIPRRLIHDTSFLRLQAVCDTVLKSFKEANYMVRSARVYSPGEWQNGRLRMIETGGKISA